MSALASLILLGTGPDVASVPPYVFRMNITMHMHGFPWASFGMTGVGEYRAGDKYVVHFTDTPWFFPKDERQTDLSMLDPAMWPNRYTAREIGKRGESTLYALRALNDPSMVSATVTFGPQLATRRVDVKYNDGTHIIMNVNYGLVNGFMVPLKLSSDINEAHTSFSANADFEDYTFAGEPTRSPAPQ